MKEFLKGEIFRVLLCILTLGIVGNTIQDTEVGIGLIFLSIGYIAYVFIVASYRALKRLFTNEDKN